MDWNEIPHDQCHIEDPSGASKTISEPMLRSVQTVNLSCVKISTISKWTKASIHMSLVTKEYHQVCPKRFMCLCYVWRKLCTYLALTLPQCLRMHGNEISHEQCHIGDSSGASKTISKPMLRSAQTVHLSCVKISTISKHKTSIHLNLVT
jgi:3-oxoacyl-(acyl-carrier-protein) synthase